MMSPVPMILIAGPFMDSLPISYTVTQFPDGASALFDHTPPKELAPYVRSMQGYVEIGAAPTIRKKVPTGVVPLILVMDQGFELHDSTAPLVVRSLSRSFVAGLQELPTSIGLGGNVICMQIDFTPIGAWRYLGIDMHEIAGRIVELDAIVGRVARELEEQVVEAKDWRSRFAILESALSTRIRHSPPEHRLAAAASIAIEQAAGDICIHELTRRLGSSRKHLASLFNRQIGISPKSLACIVRFEKALVRFQSGEFTSLADLAVASGYTDQSHFNRDCRKYTGENPIAFLTQL